MKSQCVLFGLAKSCIVMAGFLLQEIINCRGPMLATWIQFWDHWSTTLLTGTVSPYKTSRCLSNSRCSKSELLKAVPSSAEQGKLVFFCLRSHAIRHQVFFSPSNTFLSPKASFAIFFEFEIHIFYRTDKSIQWQRLSQVQINFYLKSEYGLNP